MPIDNIFRPNKRYLYTPDPLTAAFYVASGKSVSTLNTNSYYLKFIFLPYYAPETDHIIMGYKHGCATEKILYCSGCHGGI